MRPLGAEGPHSMRTSTSPSYPDVEIGFVLTSKPRTRSLLLVTPTAEHPAVVFGMLRSVGFQVSGAPTLGGDGRLRYRLAKDGAGVGGSWSPADAVESMATVRRMLRHDGFVAIPDNDGIAEMPGEPDRALAH